MDVIVPPTLQPCNCHNISRFRYCIHLVPEGPYVRCLRSYKSERCVKHAPS